MSTAIDTGFERHDLPSGATVYYREHDHSYWRDTRYEGDTWRGTGRLTGVSTVVGPFDFRPDPLMSWASRLTLEGVAALAAEGLSLEEPDDIRAALCWLESGSAAGNALRDASLTWQDIRETAASRGTNVHKHGLHALATGSAIPDTDAMTLEEQGYNRGVIAFWHEREPEPEHSEMVVADLEPGIAGRLDLICRMGSKRVLLDCKTSGFISNRQHVQIAGYDRCADRSGFGKTDDQLILQVTPDGQYHLLPVQATWQDFEDAITVYRSAARIQRGTAASLRALAA